MSGGGTNPRPVGSAAAIAAPTLVGWPRQIAWSEFTDVATRPDGETEDAQVASDTQMPSRHQIVQDQGQLKLAPFTARLVVTRSNSWVVTSKKSDVLLAHEQGHYDITGLIARDMIADIGRAHAGSAADLQQQVTSIQQTAQSLATQLTNQYDTETNHGLKTDRQQKWEAHLAALKQNGSRLTAGPP